MHLDVHRQLSSREYDLPSGLILIIDINLLHRPVEPDLLDGRCRAPELISETQIDSKFEQSVIHLDFEFAAIIQSLPRLHFLRIPEPVGTLKPVRLIGRDSLTMGYITIIVTGTAVIRHKSIDHHLIFSIPPKHWRARVPITVGTLLPQGGLVVPVILPIIQTQPQPGTTEFSAPLHSGHRCSHSGTDPDNPVRRVSPTCRLVRLRAGHSREGKRNNI